MMSGDLDEIAEKAFSGGKEYINYIKNLLSEDTQSKFYYDKLLHLSTFKPRSITSKSSELMFVSRSHSSSKAHQNSEMRLYIDEKLLEEFGKDSKNLKTDDSLLNYMIFRPYPTYTITLNSFEKHLQTKIMELGLKKLLLENHKLWGKVLKVLRGDQLLSKFKTSIHEIDQVKFKEGIEHFLDEFQSTLGHHKYLHMLIDESVRKLISEDLGWHEIHRGVNLTPWLSSRSLSAYISSISRPQFSLHIHHVLSIRLSIVSLDEADITNLFRLSLEGLTNENSCTYCPTSNHFFILYLVSTLIELLPLDTITQSDISLVQRGIEMRTIGRDPLDDVYLCAMYLWKLMTNKIDRSLGECMDSVETLSFERVFEKYRNEKKYKVGFLGEAKILGEEDMDKDRPKNRDTGISNGTGRSKSIPLGNDEEDENEDLGFIDFKAQLDDSKHTFKHLYQCLLSLQSDDVDRIRTTLEDLPYVILNNVLHLDGVGEDLITALLLMPYRHLVEGIEVKKAQCLIILLLCAPQAFCSAFMHRFFKGDCSLGERIKMLQTLNEALWELMGKKIKEPFYQKILEEIDNQENGDLVGGNGPGKMMLIVNEDEARRTEIENVKKEKIESQSRRWGYAKLGSTSYSNSVAQKFKIFETTFSDRVITRLKPVYILVFLDLVGYVQKNKELFTNNPILLSTLYQLLATFCQVSSSLSLFRKLSRVL